MMIQFLRKNNIIMQIFAFAIFWIMRNSSADQLILETLGMHKSHLTSHQIYEAVHLRLPALNPSTVYRALDRLVNQGKVTVSDMGWGLLFLNWLVKNPITIWSARVAAISLWSRMIKLLLWFQIWKKTTTTKLKPTIWCCLGFAKSARILLNY